MTLGTRSTWRRSVVLSPDVNRFPSCLPCSDNDNSMEFAYQPYDDAVSQSITRYAQYPRHTRRPGTTLPIFGRTSGVCPPAPAGICLATPEYPHHLANSVRLRNTRASRCYHLKASAAKGTDREYDGCFSTSHWSSTLCARIAECLVQPDQTIKLATYALRPSHRML